MKVFSLSLDGGKRPRLGREGLSVGGAILTSYFLHRTGHHKLERILPLIEIGYTAGTVFGMNLRHRETPPR